MKILLQLILMMTAFCSFSVFGQNTMNIEGNWVGTLEVSSAKLRLGLIVSKNPDGSLTGKLISIDQGSHNLLVDAITQQNNSIRFEAKNIEMKYDGTLNEKGDEISGQMNQHGNLLPFVFKRVAEIPKATPPEAPKRPQDPQKPYPYDEEEVTYENKKDNVTLAGTLTLPRTPGPHPAVLLITGSGTQDRNETILGHRPFLVIADYLTRRGIAVLRVDDRGAGGSSLGSLDATTESYAGDVLTGVEYLKSRKEINPKQIGLIGHSEGGMIAPMVAVRSKDVAFIVLLAGPGQTGEEVVYAQNEAGIKANMTDPVLAGQALTALKNIYTILKSDADKQTATERINEALDKQENSLTGDEKKGFAQVAASMKAGLPSLLSPWYRYFVAYNPRPTLEKVTVPVLALNGENDTQVLAKENLPLIDAALKAGGNKDYTIKSFPKLNHLFQTSQTGLVDEYGKIDETMSPVVLETIGDWILKHTR